MFIPMCKGEHWFLLVIHFDNKKCYIIDSGGEVSAKRHAKVVNLVSKPNSAWTYNLHVLLTLIVIKYMHINLVLFTDP